MPPAITSMEHGITLSAHYEVTAVQLVGTTTPATGVDRLRRRQPLLPTSSSSTACRCVSASPGAVAMRRRCRCGPGVFSRKSTPPLPFDLVGMAKNHHVRFCNLFRGARTNNDATPAGRLLRSPAVLLPRSTRAAAQRRFTGVAVARDSVASCTPPTGVTFTRHPSTSTSKVPGRPPDRARSRHAACRPPPPPRVASTRLVHAAGGRALTNDGSTCSPRRCAGVIIDGVNDGDGLRSCGAEPAGQHGNYAAGGGGVPRN
jgi:hypothetical protein